MRSFYLLTEINLTVESFFPINVWYGK